MPASETSSEENFDLLREAADSWFINDSMFTPGQTTDLKETKQASAVSLRPQMDKENQHNLLCITPEFQDYVAKHLRKTLDKQLRDTCKDLSSSTLKNENTSHCEGGVKLFQNSDIYLNAEESPPVFKRKKPKNIKKEDDVDEIEKVKAAVVSSEWIISGKGTFGWEKCKGEVLLVNASGNVIDHKVSKNTKIKSNSRGVCDRTYHIDVISHEEDMEILKWKQRHEGNHKKRKTEEEIVEKK